MAAAKAYIEEHGLSQKELAQRAGLNAAYVNAMLNGEAYVGETLIKTKAWNKLGIACGAISDEVWPTLETRQLNELLMHMVLAKQRHAVKTIIADTRHGKTVAVETFKNKYPKHTYVVTINSLLGLDDVINELAGELGLTPARGKKALKMIEIMRKLRDIRMNGGEPIVIIDEGENMNRPLMRMFKGLYDGVSRYAALVLIGTDQLDEKMVRYNDKKVEGGPQFYHRFYPAKVRVKDVEPKKDFQVFFRHFGITEPSFQGLLLRLCSNYGALNHYLLPVLEDCRDNETALTEDAFRLYHNMPKYE